MCQKVVIPAGEPGSGPFNRSCKPHFNLDSRFTVCPAGCPGMTRKGFTLIELLVVVLIIGILASVALPQYEKAVEKSRVAQMYPLVKDLAEAEQAYYMANGAYTCDFSLLDIDFNFGEPFSQGYGTSLMTGQKTKDWKVGCLDNGNWWSIRAMRQGGRYPVQLQYSLTKWGAAKPGWYCVDDGQAASPCQKLWGLPAGNRVVSNWHGCWYTMDGQ